MSTFVGWSQSERVSSASANRPHGTGAHMHTMRAVRNQQHSQGCGARGASGHNVDYRWNLHESNIGVTSKRCERGSSYLQKLVVGWKVMVSGKQQYLLHMFAYMVKHVRKCS